MWALTTRNLTLDFPASGTLRNRCFCRSHPVSLQVSVTGAQKDSGAILTRMIATALLPVLVASVQPRSPQIHASRGAPGLRGLAAAPPGLGFLVSPQRNVRHSLSTLQFPAPPVLTHTAPSAWNDLPSHSSSG